jgi:hypothetical protein
VRCDPPPPVRLLLETEIGFANRKVLLLPRPLPHPDCVAFLTEINRREKTKTKLLQKITTKFITEMRNPKMVISISNKNDNARAINDNIEKR